MTDTDNTKMKLVSADVLAERYGLTWAGKAHFGSLGVSFKHVTSAKEV